jgi:hypothetical protein
MRADTDRCTIPESALPGEGWYCTRAKGHAGPCAAVDAEKAVQERLSDLFRGIRADSVMPANVSRREYENRMQMMDRALGEKAPQGHADRLERSIAYHHRLIWALVVAQFATCTILFTVLR